MECVNCKHCRFPRSENDNNGSCKCKIMKNKTIDVYVCGGETPAWCPLKQEESNFSLRLNEIIGEVEKRYFEMIDGKRTLCIADYHAFVLEKLNRLKQKGE